MPQPVPKANISRYELQMPREPTALLPDDLITDVELASWIRYEVRSVRNLRYSGRGPKFIKVGRLIRYRVKDVTEWLESNIRTSTSDTRGAA